MSVTALAIAIARATVQTGTGRVWMRSLRVACVIVIGLTVGCASAPTRDLSSLRESSGARSFRSRELRALPHFARMVEDGSPFQLLHEAFLTGTAPTVEEAFPPCFAADGETLLNIGRQSTLFVTPKSEVVEPDTGSQYCRVEDDVEITPAQPAAGPRFPARPAKTERRMVVVRVAADHAPAVVAPEEIAQFKALVRTSPTTCVRTQTSLQCSAAIEPTYGKLFIRKLAKWNPDEGDAFAFHVETSVDAKASETEASQYIYIWTAEK